MKFYTRLGLTFISEKHGDGPVHYSSFNEGFVLELYPLKAGAAAAHSIRLGFAVDSVDETVRSLESVGGTCVSPPHDSEWGRRAVVKDFDGNDVELSRK